MGRSNATGCYYKVIFIDKSSACFDSKKESKTVRDRHISKSRHFSFIVCNHLYPLSEVHALDLLTKVIGFTSDRGVQIDPLFEAILCKAVGILIQGFAIQYFISNIIVDEQTSVRMISKKIKIPDDESGSCSYVLPFTKWIRRYW